MGVAHPERELLAASQLRRLLEETPSEVLRARAAGVREAECLEEQTHGFLLFGKWLVRIAEGHSVEQRPSGVPQLRRIKGASRMRESDINVAGHFSLSNLH